MSNSTALSPRKQAVQDRSKFTVGAILEAAAQVFQTYGYAAGTTDRIAERAGVSVGTLYQYFPNKDTILVVLAERHIDEGFAQVHRFLDPIERIGKEELRPLIVAFFKANVALHTRDARLHQVLFEEAPLPKRVHEHLKDGERVVLEKVRAILAASEELRVEDPGIAAYVILQTLESMAHNFVLHPPEEIGERIDEEKFVEEVVEMTVRYLAPD